MRSKYEKFVVSLHVIKTSLQRLTCLYHYNIIYNKGQMGRLKLILALISHYKYAITIIIGILTVGFVDENSFLHRFQLEMQINDLEEEIDKYNAQNESDLKKLKDMRKGTQEFQKIARERYFMKADDEDIYVLSDDPKPEQDKEEQ